MVHDFRHYTNLTFGFPPMPGDKFPTGQWIGPLPTVKVVGKGEGRRMEVRQ